MFFLFEIFTSLSKDKKSLQSEAINNQVMKREGEKERKKERERERKRERE